MAGRVRGGEGRDMGGNLRGTGRARSAGLPLRGAGRQGIYQPGERARESALVERIQAYLGALPRCRVRKQHGSAYNVGEPDLVGCYRGQYFAIECKQAGERPTALQEAALVEIQAAGGWACWCDSFEGFLHWWRAHTLGAPRRSFDSVRP